MAIIEPEALYKGERLRRCSDQARLAWPYLFLAADGFGRLHLDYRDLVGRVYLGFKNPPAEETFWVMFQEYRDNHLAFLYEAGGNLWCQWYCKPNCLPRHKTKRDYLSPEPPQSEYDKWISSYVKQTRALPAIFRNLPKSCEIFPRGLGVGEGKQGVRQERGRFPENSENFGNLSPPPAEPPEIVCAEEPEPVKTAANGKHSAASVPAWRIDEQFCAFVQEYSRSKLDAIDEDWAAAYHAWKVLDLEQKIAATSQAKKKRESGRWADSQYVPLPAKWLQGGYKRPILASAAPKKSAFELMCERAKELGRPDGS